MLSGSKSGEFLHNAIMKHFIICLEINQMAEIECIFISLICCNYCNILPKLWKILILKCAKNLLYCSNQFKWAKPIIDKDFNARFINEKQCFKVWCSISEIYCANIEQYRYSGGGQDLENRTVHIKHSPIS